MIDPRELVSVIGVRFKPGGAFPFLATSASELADVHVDLEALWGTSAMEREAFSQPSTFLKLISRVKSAALAKRYLSNYVDQMSARTRLKFPPRIFSTAALL